MGIFSKLKQAWFGDVNWEKLDDEFFDNLEESLILADVGVNIAAESVNSLRNAVFSYDMKDPEQVKAELRKILLQKLSVGETALDTAKSPTVILVIGVNGVGKTTSIGKLANRLKAEGKKVLLCAADTFRAAAADQLEIWAKRADVPIVRQHEGADPGAVLFDALQAAKARNIDVVLCDTAGRLHNKQNLMNELNKISRVIDRELPGCVKETLLVLDATTGQNGLIQAKQFKEAAGVTGIVLTKLDGSAKILNVITTLEEAAVQRSQGWQDAIKALCDESKLEWVTVEATSSEDAMATTESALQANPDVDMVLVYNDEMGIGAYQAIVQSGLDTTNMYLGSCDGTDTVLDYVQEDTVYRCTVGNDRFVSEIGFYWVENMVKIALGMDYDDPFPITTIAITKDNVDDYRSREPEYVISQDLIDFVNNM